MATIYTDLHNKAKENVSVIRKPGFTEDGMTQQLVKLLNHENEYWGTFHGTIDSTSADIKNATIDGATIKNAVLDNVSFKDGLCLDDFASQFQVLCDKIDDEISSRKTCAGKIVENLYKYIDLSGNFLSGQINSLSNEIVFEKHIKISNIDDTKYPYSLNDWSVNNLDTACPAKYVYLNKIDKDHIIGKISNVKYNPIQIGTEYIDYVDSFEFNILNPTIIDASLSSLTTTRYQFTQSNTSIELNSKIKLVWKNHSSSKIYDFIIAIEDNNGNEICQALKLGETSIIEIMMPNKKEQIPNITDGNNRSEYFIFNARFSDLVENGSANSEVPNLISIKFVPPDGSEYKYSYLGKTITANQTIKFVKNTIVSLKFEELQEGVFQITDLNNTELVYRTKDLKDKYDLLTNITTELSNKVSGVKTIDTAKINKLNVSELSINGSPFIDVLSNMITTIINNTNS